MSCKVAQKPGSQRQRKLNTERCLANRPHKTEKGNDRSREGRLTNDEAASTRSVAIQRHENAPAIEAWRATLTDRRKRLIHPLSNVRARRAESSGARASSESFTAGLQRDALAAWHQFRDCLEALPPDQAE